MFAVLKDYFLHADQTEINFSSQTINQPTANWFGLEIIEA